MKNIIRSTLAVLILSVGGLAQAADDSSVYSCVTSTEPKIDITIIHTYTNTGAAGSQVGVLKTENQALRLLDLAIVEEKPKNVGVYSIKWTAYEFELVAHFAPTPSRNFTADLKWHGVSYTGLNCDML